MAYNKSKLMALVAVVMILAMSMMVAEAAVTCGTVTSDLSQCVNYVEGKMTAPTSQCCSGVKSLYSITKNSRPDRVTACNCIKSLTKALGSAVQPSAIAALPGQCGVNLGYSISPSTNCNTIP